MNKKEYLQANKDWLTAKAKEQGVRPLQKGVYYKVLTEGNPNGKHPSPRSTVLHACKQVEQRISVEKSFADDVQKLMEELHK